MYYFNGEKSIEETAAAIRNKIDEMPNATKCTANMDVTVGVEMSTYFIPDSDALKPAKVRCSPLPALAGYASISQAILSDCVASQSRLFMKPPEISFA